jgi:hypothetical protein
VKAVGISVDLVPKLFALHDFDTFQLSENYTNQIYISCLAASDARNGHRSDASLFQQSSITVLHFSIVHPALLFYSRSQIHYQLILDFTVSALLLGWSDKITAFRKPCRKTGWSHKACQCNCPPKEERRAAELQTCNGSRVRTKSQAEMSSLLRNSKKGD